LRNRLTIKTNIMNIRKEIDSIYKFLSEQNDNFELFNTIHVSDIDLDSLEKTSIDGYFFNHYYQWKKLIKKGEYFVGSIFIPIGDDVYLECIFKY